MEILCEVAVQQWTTDSASSQDENFSGVSVFSGQSKRCRVFVMNFVNVLVEIAGMESLMR